MQINLDKLMLAMAKAETSVKDLQVSTSLSTVTICRIKSGEQQPRPATVGKLAKALGVSVEYLVKEDAINE